MDHTVNMPTTGKGDPSVSLVKRVLKMRETGLILIILALFIGMSFASPYFLTWVNIRAMTMAFAVEGIVVVGMTVLLISGGIDLSVGSVLGARFDSVDFAEGNLDPHPFAFGHDGASCRQVQRQRVVSDAGFPSAPACGDAPDPVRDHAEPCSEGCIAEAGAPVAGDHEGKAQYREDKRGQGQTGRRGIPLDPTG